MKTLCAVASIAVACLVSSGLPCASGIHLVPADDSGSKVQYLNGGLVTKGPDGKMMVENADGTSSPIDVDYDLSLGDLPDRDRTMPHDALGGDAVTPGAGISNDEVPAGLNVRDALAGSSLTPGDISRSVGAASGVSGSASHAEALASEGYVPDDLHDVHAMGAPELTQAELEAHMTSPQTQSVQDGIDEGTDDNDNNDNDGNGGGGDVGGLNGNAAVISGRYTGARPANADPAGYDPDDMNERTRAVDNASPSQDDPVTPEGTGYSNGDPVANLRRMYPSRTERVVTSDPARLSQPPVQLSQPEDSAETLTDDIAVPVRGEDTEVLGAPERGWGRATRGLHDARETRVLDESIIDAGKSALHLPNADGAVNDLAEVRGGFTGANERDALENMPLPLERTPAPLERTPFLEGMQEHIIPDTPKKA